MLGNPLSREDINCFLAVQIITHGHDIKECVCDLSVFVNHTPKYMNQHSLGCVQNAIELEAGLYSHMAMPFPCYWDNSVS